LKRFAAIVLLLLLPCFAFAQTETKDDRDFLTAFLEDNLSDAGREVRVKGFSGSLSAESTIEELTIADDGGVWITLRDVVLDWNQSALLRGRIEVNTLSVREILLPRFPKTDASTPSPEATEFTLPELPVSVEIAAVKADRVVLGAAVLSREATVKLEASLSLNAGAGDAEVSIARIDGELGTLRFAGGYSNATRELSLDVALTEGKGGIVSTLLNLPDTPAIAMTVKGTGPLDDYIADISLLSDNEPRLTGQVTIVALRDENNSSNLGHAFGAEIGGDIAPLFAPDYRSFFGSDIQLKLSGERLTDGQVTLDTLALKARSVSIEGSGAIGAEGWPERFELEAEISDQSGSPVLLPLSGGKTLVDSLTLDLAYNHANDDDWKGTLLLDGLVSENLTAETLLLAATGKIFARDGTALGRVTSEVFYSADGLILRDEGLAAALGSEISGDTQVEWIQEEPVVFRNAILNGDNFSISGQAAFAGLQDDFNVEGEILLTSGDLSRFSLLVGRPLKGAGRVNLAGQGDLLGGSFDLTLKGQTQDLGIGQSEVDRLLRGTADLLVAVARDTTGLRIDQFEITTPELTAGVSGQLGSVTGDLRYTARLNNLGIFVSGLNGPLSLNGTASRSNGEWQIDANGDGPAGTVLSIAGGVAVDGQSASLALAGNAPLGLANPFITPRTLDGNARFDLRLDGPFALSSISGQVTAGAVRASIPLLRLALTNVAVNAQISGGRAVIDLTGAVTSGGQFSVNGPVSLTPPYAGELAVQLRSVGLIDPALYQTNVNGAVTVNGPVTGGALIAGALTLGPTEIQVPTSGFTEGGDLPGLVHVNEPASVRETRRRAGLLDNDAGSSGGAAYPVDLTISAPSRIFVRGRGLDVELGGELRLGGTTDNLIPSGRFDLIRGRLDILGKRLTLDEGYAQLQGEFVPYLRFVATSSADEFTVNVIVEGNAADPAISFTSQPELPEDEVLSRLFFGRAITEISPFQAAQLASAVATLSGRGGVGLVSRLRDKFGLDDLDVASNEEGTTGVRAGKYISENVYTDVTIGSDGTSEINLNLDISPALTVKGGLGQDGNTSMGVFFERDY